MSCFMKLALISPALLVLGILSIGAQPAVLAAPSNQAVAKSRLALVPPLIRDAMAASDQIIGPGDKANALAAIGATRARAGNLAGAQESFAEAALTIQTMKDGRKDAYIALARAEATVHFADTRQTFASALDATQESQVTWDRCNQIADVAVAEARAGLPDLSRQTFAQAITLARSISDFTGRSMATSGIAERQADVGNKVTARSLATEAAQEIAVNGTDPNSLVWQDHARGLTIASAQAKSGDLDGAMSTIGLIKDPYFVMRGTYGVTLARAEAGQFQPALVMARTIKGDNFDSLVLFNIVTDQVNAGDLAGAKATALTMQNPDMQSNALHVVATGYAKAGRIDDARAILATFKDPNLALPVLSEIAVAQAQAGDIAGAQQAAAALTDPLTKALTFAHIADALLKTQPRKSSSA